MGDIKRILSYKASAMTLGSFDGDGETAFSGTVEYKVLYLDSDGAPTEAVFSSDYEYKIKVSEDFAGSIDIPEISALSVRAAGPRKLSARATVSSDVFVKTEHSAESIGIPTEAVLKKRRITPMLFDRLESKEVELAEGVKLEGVGAEEIEVISSCGEAVVEDCFFTGGAATLKGTINAYAILRLGDNTYTRVEKSIPFEVDVECAATAGKILPVCCITSLTVNVNNDDGDDVCSAVVFSVITELGGAVIYSDEQQIAEDGFIPGAICDNVYEKVTYLESVLCDVVNTPLSFEFDKREFAEGNIIEILSAEPSLKINSETVSDGRIITDGEICFNILSVCGEGDDLSCVTLTHKFETKEKIQNTPWDALKKITRRRINSTKVTFDTGKIYVKCNLVSEYQLLCNKEACLLKELRNKIEKKSEGATVRVYYPEESDSLWSVAKRYGVSPEKLSSDNGIASPTLASEEGWGLGDAEMLVIAEI
jgi:hypothetical protein